MSISIIQLDSRAPAGQLAEHLPDAHIVRFDDGESLPDPLDLAGLVVLGGRQNAYDPQLAPVAELLRECTARDLPTLGICLGAQLLATSHGGAVEIDAPAGPERGIITIRTRPSAEKDPVLGGAVEHFGREFAVVSMHADAVTNLPEGALWLASSRQYPYQAFRLGSALGVQFHPEATASIFGEWLNREEGVERAEAEGQWHSRAEDLTSLGAAVSLGLARAAASN